MTAAELHDIVKPELDRGVGPTKANGARIEYRDGDWWERPYDPEDWGCIDINFAVAAWEKWYRQQLYAAGYAVHSHQQIGGYRVYLSGCSTPIAESHPTEVGALALAYRAACPEDKS